MTNGTLTSSGTLTVRKIGIRGPGLAWKLRNNTRRSFIWGWLTTGAARLFSRVTGIPTMTGQLELCHIRADGRRVNYGVVSRRLVTTAFVGFVTDQLQTETAVFGDFKYHDSGVGTTAENASDTAIETTDGEARATGTQTESAANAYRSVGTISYTTTKAITEHGLFNDATAGTLMDRSVFSAVNVVNGESIQFTYTHTFNSGG
jgi:hypothetical protein